jgi:hypothetical protein
LPCGREASFERFNFLAERRPPEKQTRRGTTSTHGGLTRGAIERIAAVRGRVFLFTAIAGIFLLVPAPASAQLEIGASGGFVSAWSQDVHVEEPNYAGHMYEVVHEKEKPLARGGLWGVGVDYWWKPRSSVGLQLGAVGWENQLAISHWPTMTRQCYAEQHLAFLANVTGRLMLTESGRSYLYGGIGGGPGISRLRRSRTQLGPALSLVAGACLPAGHTGVTACLESRYMITRDFNARVHTDNRDQNLRLSGHPSSYTARPIFGPHQDARFLAVSLGLRWAGAKA